MTDSPTNINAFRDAQVDRLYKDCLRLLDKREVPEDVRRMVIGKLNAREACINNGIPIPADLT